MVLNRFFSSVVIQAESGQYVVAAGPYASVRHPGYLAGILIMVASGPALGSWLALLVISSLPFLLHRAITEDRVLRAELPGYSAIMRAASAGAFCREFGETDQGSRVSNFAVVHRQGPAGDGRCDAAWACPNPLRAPHTPLARFGFLTLIQQSARPIDRTSRDASTRCPRSRARKRACR
jgi:hypothetical protein